MNVTLAIGVLGMLVIAAIGFYGRRQPVKDMDEWAVAGRKFGVMTTWVLQAGETFTTFTFLGTVGLVVSLGASAFYCIPYIPLAYLVMYWIAPKLWRRAKAAGYVTQSDFLRGSYNSPTLGFLSAVFGIIFLLPYLQLQITGLGLIVRAATGGAADGTISSIVAFVLVIAFVLWSGLHGVARTSYFKDVLMILVMLVISIAIPMHFNGGLDFGLSTIAREMPEMLYVQTGTYGIWWFITSMAISMIGVMFYALPHNWPAVLASRSEKAVRQNLIYLPIYSALASIPMLLGYTAIVAFGTDQDGDSAMLKMASEALPPWAMGVVLTAAAATAMVPSAALLIAIAPLAVNNVFQVKDEKRKFVVNQAVVVVFGLAALVLALSMPNLLGNMLLLTFSGSTQVVPAIAGALLLKRRLDKASVIAGLCAGVFTVILLTFAPFDGPDINTGISGLIVNIAVIAVIELVIRVRRSVATPHDPIEIASEAAARA
ncbi:SSS family solute:Na+ symporter [Rhodococcus sp. PvR044]|uniref:sodium:solute symporter family protein n=1 Tax=Rhodococcus TaxID=1827 RepID=UPI000BCD5357|nr:MULTISPECIES: sodium:solute symporter family protein [Rhodococcus]MCZ4556938.1 sodium:solute symporter family protein [Rhodococcus maanshanensis]PTR41127.1 SSS family solute:Na+ symporter [Rhodococcus sp. OK611]SNX91949.1 solute:Na+ symporter, SSS family [Rhodococcus sp. OK270]